jgi:hypothetical protein
MTEEIFGLRCNQITIVQKHCTVGLEAQTSVISYRTEMLATGVYFWSLREVARLI